MHHKKATGIHLSGKVPTIYLSRAKLLCSPHIKFAACLCFQPAHHLVSDAGPFRKLDSTKTGCCKRISGVSTLADVSLPINFTRQQAPTLKQSSRSVKLDQGLLEQQVLLTEALVAYR